MMKRLIVIAIFLAAFGSATSAQSKIVKDFTPVCDSLAVLTTERTGVNGKLTLKSIMKRGGNLDFYFTESLGDYPLHKDDVKWFKTTLKSLFPEEYKKYKLGEIYSRMVGVDKLITPELTYDGSPADTRHRTKSPSGSRLIVEKLGGQTFEKGLSGRHLAVWQSHGRYFDTSLGLWTWQRPCLFQTCEDMFTQSFVLPYLVPMLENAGAYVLLPRERDVQKNEIIVDNNESCGARGTGSYIETGKWSDTGQGFADPKEIYEDLENPFVLGTAKQAKCVGPSAKANASITWTPNMPERGEYAVYVSYKTLPNSTTAAHYTVRHLGGTSEFIVNQKMGGSTWVYLGTFEFAKGSDGYVSLDNSTPKGYRMEVSATVTADAVRFGGGMGNIARGNKEIGDTTSFIPEPTVSGLPRSAEGAKYWLQWAGADSTIYYQNSGSNDYKDDFMSRGDWVEWISRGSRTNPNKKGGLGIPVDLSLGFHTDAGVTPNDSIIGTLAIYTYKSEGKTTLPSGENRMSSRQFSETVQTQIVNDLRAGYDSLWTRRSIWDRGYRESRTPSSPAMLLELLSHQNFADMKLGHDPSFRFAVSRAIYKGILKYLSSRFGQSYVVQPLPVENMGVQFNGNGKAAVTWTPVNDPLEPTAKPTGYIVYSRIGSGAFDNGTYTKECRFETALIRGEVMSFKVAAYNEGGVGFTSEIVSIGIPEDGSTDESVLIVNNFDRVSGPSYFDGADRAGFDNSIDGGVADKRDITFIGEMYNFRREDEWITNSRPGFGASYSDQAGNIVAGNTFDYAAVHGKAILAAGHAFYSCSNERFTSDSLFCKTAWTIDLICGKQVTTPVGDNRKYTVFYPEMQSAIEKASRRGTHLIVSGAYIGTDIEDSIYPINIDSDIRKTASTFAKNVLGYKFVTNQASRRGGVKPVINKQTEGMPALEIVSEMNPEKYCVESPDGIAPATKSGVTIYRYTDSNISAGVVFDGNGYRCVSYGFPIEALKNDETINQLIVKTLEYIKK